jgi:hypothetical protein
VPQLHSTVLDSFFITHYSQGCNGEILTHVPWETLLLLLVESPNFGGVSHLTCSACASVKLPSCAGGLCLVIYSTSLQPRIAHGLLCLPCLELICCLLGHQEEIRNNNKIKKKRMAV